MGLTLQYFQFRFRYTGAMRMHQMETINRRTWRNPLALRQYRRTKDYVNEGERVLMAQAERRHDGGRILDLGCGGGRTANLVKHFAGDYLGVDYTPQMVSMARTNHPGLRFEHMDARDLSLLPDADFDLVLFSFNGIDSVDPEGRLAVLSEVARVLEPGGSFAFSSFNRNWHGFNLSARPRPPGGSWVVNPVRMAARVVRWGIGKTRERRYMVLEQRGEHAILLHSAHEFGIMVYATTPSQLRQQLISAGFAPEVEIMRTDGQPIQDEMEADNEYFHILAQKPLGSRAS